MRSAQLKTLGQFAPRVARRDSHLHLGGMIAATVTGEGGSEQ